METRIWYSPSLRSANFIVPGLLAVILMAFPPLLTALAIVREKETGTIQQIYASPVTSAEFIGGKLVPYGAVALIEMLLLIVASILWFQVPFHSSMGLLIAASLIYVLTTVGIGLFVSPLTRTQVAAMLAALIVTLMPSFLFSGFLFPIFTMPFSMQLYSLFIPASADLRDPPTPHRRRRPGSQRHEPTFERPVRACGSIRPRARGGFSGAGARLARVRQSGTGPGDSEWLRERLSEGASALLADPSRWHQLQRRRERAPVCRGHRRAIHRRAGAVEREPGGHCHRAHDARLVQRRPGDGAVHGAIDASAGGDARSS